MNNLNNPVNPLETPPQPGFSRLAIIVGVLVMVIIVGGAYFLGTQKNKMENDASQQISPSTQTNPTTSAQESDTEWKTYADKNDTFTMRYPSNFFATQDTPMGDLNPDISAGAISTSLPYNDSLNNESDMVIEMTIKTLPENLTLNNYIETKVLTYPSEDTDMDGTVGPPFKITPSKRKVINLDGKEAVWLEGMAFMSVSHTEVFIPYKENKIIFVSIYEGTAAQENRNQEQYQKNIQLAEHILSTLQFSQ